MKGSKIPLSKISAEAGNHEKNQENNEEHLRDARCSSCQTGESQDSCDQRENEKGQCPVEHIEKRLFYDVLSAANRPKTHDSFKSFIIIDLNHFQSLIDPTAD